MVWLVHQIPGPMGSGSNGQILGSYLFCVILYVCLCFLSVSLTCILIAHASHIFLYYFTSLVAVTYWGVVTFYTNVMLFNGQC